MRATLGATPGHRDRAAENGPCKPKPFEEAATCLDEYIILAAKRIKQKRA